MTRQADTLPALHEGFAEIAWRIDRAKSGAPTLAVGGRSVHSAADPEAEARRIASDLLERARRDDARCILLIGLGLGFVATALARDTALPIVALEPFLDLASALQQTGCVKRPGGVTLAVGVNAFPAALDALGDAAVRPIVHRQAGYADPCRFEARWLAGELRRRAGIGRHDPGEAVLSARGIDALARLPRLRSAGELDGALAGATAILVSPGPSLAPSLPALARRRGGVVIAALQALRPLVEAGVFVDIVVAPDPLHFAPFVDGVVPRFGVLLADAGAPPGLLDRWPDRTALFSLRSPQLHHVAAERLGLPSLDEPFLTVSEVCLVLAARFGVRRMIQLGADFVSEDLRYAVRFEARGADGSRLPTNSHYFHAARDLAWRVPQLVAQGVCVMRAGGGLPVAGARVLDRDAIAREITAAQPLPELARMRLHGAGARPIEVDARRRAVAQVVAEASAPPDRALHADADGGRTSDPRFADFHPLPAGRRLAVLHALHAQLTACG